MKYFGTDGIRGEANVNLTPQTAFRFGQSLVNLGLYNVVIGWDTRQSSEMLVYSVAAGAISVGLNIIFAGIIPTPGLAYFALENKITGVMVTASHNPYHDNGLKVFHQGLKLTPEQESLIEESMDKEVTLSSNLIGKVLEVHPTPKERYLEFVKLHAPRLDLRIGIDTANGALHDIAPTIFKMITPNIFVSGDTPNGTNINDGVGTTHMGNIQTLIKKHQLDIGFSFDGDGDRMLLVDNEGTLYDGDLIAYTIANYLKSENQLYKDTVVLTKMSNLGVIKKLKEHGINTMITDVGDKYILQELYTNGYSLGSENSGHLILPYILKAGDGLLASLFLLKVIKETGKSLKELTSEVVFYPEKLANIRVKDRNIAKHAQVVERVEQIKVELQGDGKVLVRASGTEPLVRVSVSAPTKEKMEAYMNELVQLVHSLDK